MVELNFPADVFNFDAAKKLRENPEMIMALKTESAKEAHISLSELADLDPFHVRSQDMFHAWPRNMFGALSLQKEIADSAGYDFGYLTMITHSAHIYADDWSLTRGLLDDYYEAELKYKRGFHFHEDPRGNWVIEADHPKKLISAKLYTNDMATVLKNFEGSTAREVQWKITDWELISLADHAASIGIELSKAEVALQLGIEYNQDKPLDYQKMVSREKIPAFPRYVKKGKKNIRII